MSKRKTLGPVTLTDRGFQKLKFADHYNATCSLQQSSLASYQKPGSSCVWLGIEDAKPQLLWRDALMLGIKTDATEGWVPYPIPPQVMLTTWMHLDRDRVKRLIHHLQKWLDTGELGRVTKEKGTE